MGPKFVPLRSARCPSYVALFRALFAKGSGPYWLGPGVPLMQPTIRKIPVLTRISSRAPSIKPEPPHVIVLDRRGPAVVEDNIARVEAQIAVEDISEVRPKMRADVHLTAYKQRITPVVHGEVMQVSADPADR